MHATHSCSPTWVWMLFHNIVDDWSFESSALTTGGLLANFSWTRNPELIWLGSKLKLIDFDYYMSLNISSVVVEPIDSVHPRQRAVDATARWQIVISLLFHLRRLRQFRCMLETSSRQWFVSAFILSRIDLCNAAPFSLYVCIPSTCTERFSTVRRRSTGASSRHRHHADVTLGAGRHCIRHKLCLMVYAVYNGTGPSYIAATTTRI